MLRSLGLGNGAWLSLHPNTRTSTEDAATRYAISILQALKDNRAAGPCLSAARCPQWVGEAQKLPPFTKQTSASWWLVGKQAFLEAVPHPERIEELHKLAHTKNTPAQKRALILERIGRALGSLAPAGAPGPASS